MSRWGAAVLTAFFLAPRAAFPAQESPLEALARVSGSVVRIRAISGTVVRGRPQGIFDQATAQLVVVNKIRPMVFSKTGIGFFIDREGLIMTNAHTVRQAAKVTVTLADFTKRDAEVIGFSPETDIAFLAIRPPFSSKPLSFADPEKFRTGMPVYLIAGLGDGLGTFMEGKLTGTGPPLARGPMKRAGSLLRLTFGLSKGDSGSPVIDGSGKVVGMIAAKSGAPRASYAIPAGVLRKAYEEFRNRLS